MEENLEEFLSRRKLKRTALLASMKYYFIFGTLLSLIGYIGMSNQYKPIVIMNLDKNLFIVVMIAGAFLTIIGALKGMIESFRINEKNTLHNAKTNETIFIDKTKEL